VSVIINIIIQEIG